MDDNIIEFNKNPVQKIKKELADKATKLAETQKELVFYKSLANNLKSISELLRLQTIDLEANVESLRQQLNIVDNNLKGLKQKLNHVNQIMTKS